MFGSLLTHQEPGPFSWRMRVPEVWVEPATFLVMAVVRQRSRPPEAGLRRSPKGQEGKKEGQSKGEERADVWLSWWILV